MDSVKRNILLNPGPATTTDSVKYAQVVPDICPREAEFGQLMRKIRRDLVRIVNGGEEYTSVLFGGSGTAVMEATVASVIPSDSNSKVLLLINGAYGKRLQQIAETYRIPAETYETEWGKPLSWKDIRTLLSGRSDVRYLAMVHHETTTGILNPLEPFLEIAREFDLTTIADTISSYAGIPIDVERTPIDYLMSTSNKCLQGMPGIGFVICKHDALQALQNQQSRTFYLDLCRQYEKLEETGQTRFTPPVQTIYALRQAIEEYLREGIHERWERYKSNYRVLTDGLQNLGFRLLLGDTVNHSHLLTTIFEPTDANYDFEELHDRLYERGYTIYPGKIASKDTFRLAVLGAIDQTDIMNFLGDLETVLNEMNVSVQYE